MSDDQPLPGTPRRTGRRRHRRVDAPPTNPQADRSDDVPADPRGDAAPRPPQAGPKDARDAWIEEQRPPHWD